jgi:hypothetical protein
LRALKWILVGLIALVSVSGKAKRLTLEGRVTHTLRIFLYCTH